LRRSRAPREVHLAFRAKATAKDAIRMKRLVRVAARRLREYISGVSVATPHVAGPTPEALIEAATFLFRQFDAPTFERFRLEFLTNDVFFDLLNHRFLEHRKRRHPLGSDTGYVGKFEYLYLVVRAMRPNLVVETGVFDGISSSVILQALQDANAGKLVSVDLPATNVVAGSTDRMGYSSLPNGCRPGWVIPDYLRSRHELILDDSRTALPSIFETHGYADLFFHDSLHTFDHQYFEYNLAWAHLHEDGILASDDITWNNAFSQFCSERRTRYVQVRGMGAVRKETS